MEREQPVLEDRAGGRRRPGRCGSGRCAAARRPGQPAGEPRLDGGVHVLVLGRRRGAGRRRPRRARAQPAPQPGVVGAGDQPRRPKPLDVAEAPEHVPPEQPGIPRPVVADGVLEHARVERRRPAPRACRASPWGSAPAEYSRASTGVEGPRRRHLGQVHVLVRRVRAPAGPRPALDRVGVAQEDPVGAGRAAERPRVRAARAARPRGAGSRPASRRAPAAAR